MMGEAKRRGFWAFLDRLTSQGLRRTIRVLEARCQQAGREGLDLYAENEYLRTRVNLLSCGREIPGQPGWREAMDYGRLHRERDDLAFKCKRLEKVIIDQDDTWKEFLNKFPTASLNAAPAVRRKPKRKS